MFLYWHMCKYAVCVGYCRCCDARRAERTHEPYHDKGDDRKQRNDDDRDYKSRADIRLRAAYLLVLFTFILLHAQTSDVDDTILHRRIFLSTNCLLTLTNGGRVLIIRTNVAQHALRKQKERYHCRRRLNFHARRSLPPRWI